MRNALIITLIGWVLVLWAAVGQFSHGPVEAVVHPALAKAPAPTCNLPARDMIDTLDSQGVIWAMLKDDSAQRFIKAVNDMPPATVPPLSADAVLVAQLQGDPSTIFVALIEDGCIKNMGGLPAELVRPFLDGLEGF